MKHVRFEETHPAFIPATEISTHVSAFKTRIKDFELRKISLRKDEKLSLRSGTTEIFLIMEGEAEVKEHDQNEFWRKKGESFVSFADAAFSIGGKEDSTIYFASIPGH
jgi:mannose-6-phosphate isomerase class I